MYSYYRVEFLRANFLEAQNAGRMQVIKNFPHELAVMWVYNI